MKHPIARTLFSLIAVSVAASADSHAAIAGEPSQAPSTSSHVPPDLARRIQDTTDAVLEHHIDPPARQQMILSGIKGLYHAAGLPLPLGLGRRVSALSTPEQLAALLAEVWPQAPAATISTNALEKALLEGLLASVSGRAQLFSAKERKVAEQFAGNRYVGIQIALRMDEQAKRPAIAEVLEGGPADRARAMKDDVIEQVNGVDTKGLDLMTVVDRLRGEEGTDVTIEVRQPNAAKSRTLKMTRGTLPHPTVLGVRKKPSGGWDVQLDGPTPIGYLRISEIAASTPHELRTLVRPFENQGNWGLVLDLRGLRGTSLHPAVMLADSLLAGGVIGRVQTAQRELTFQADSDDLFRGRPIAVLVDSDTSGTAEWLAAALQDNHRAIIVGVPTASATYPTRAGADSGDVRSMVTIGDGSWSIELTTGRLERGDGRPLQAAGNVPQTGDRVRPMRPPDPDKIKTGVKPDHMVGGNRSDATKGTPPLRRQSPNQGPSAATDEMLQEAVRLLRVSLQRYI